MGHPLNKSKSSSKTTLFENPLFNGTLFAKIIQRLKIGAAKGVLTPLDQKQLKSNMDVVKNELLNRGYEVVRKLNIYRPSYNFYLGLLS
jgi:lipopolysaccharide export system protein LptC